MKGIEFEVIYLNEEQKELVKLDIEASLEEGKTEKITFYRIDAISKIEENGKEYGVIHSNGDEFYTVLSYEELAEQLAKF